MPTEKENQALDLIERLGVYFRDHHTAVEKENDRFYIAVKEMLKTEASNISKLSLTNGKPTTTLADTTNGPVIAGQVDPAIKEMQRLEAEASGKQKRDEPVQMELKGGGKD